jgi:uncharacterized protein
MNIGRVISVDFDQFKVKILNSTKSSVLNINGSIYYFGNIGSYLKVENIVGEVIICEVISILDSSYEKNIRNSFDIESNRELIVKPIGTINKKNKFTLGIGIFPTIYSDVSILEKEDLEIILNPPKNQISNSKVHQDFELGISKNLINYPITINIDHFFNIHSAILGNSGSGKSNTIAHILQQILNKKNNCALGSKIILFDVNGEYFEAFKEINDEIDKKVYKPNITALEESFQPFYLPHYLLNLEEWCAFLMATDATQRPFWDMVLQECFRFYKIKTGGAKDKEVFINYFRFKLYNIINNIITRPDSDTANITTAGNALGKIKELLKGEDFKGIKEVKELLEDIDLLYNECKLNYGQNQGRVSEKLKVIEKKIDFDRALEVFGNKLKYGEYYDYQFLKIAAELILLEEEASGKTRIREYTGTMLTRLDYFLYNPECTFMREKSSFNSIELYLKGNLGIDDESRHSQLITIDSSEVSPDILELLTSVISRLVFDNRKIKSGDFRRKAPVHLILDEAHRYIKKDRVYILKENIFDKIAREGRKYSLYLLISSQRPSEISETVLSQCGNFIIHRIQNELDMRNIYAILPYFSETFTNKIKQSVPGEALIFGNCVPMPLYLKVHKANPEPNSQNCKISEEWYQNTQNVDGTEEVISTINLKLKE